MIDPERYEYPAHRRSPWGRVGVSLFFLLIAALLLWRLWPFHEALHDPAAKPREIAPSAGLLPQEIANNEVYEKSRKSVVSITTVAFQRDPTSLEVEEVPQGAGSGFIWDEKGFIVTNYHVIQDNTYAQVTLWDGSVHKGRAIGLAPDKDLAVLKIEARGMKLVPIQVGTSNDLKVGQLAYAMGNPFGIGQTFTEGVISALQRRMKSVTGRPIDNVLQTTASINPGNSGGPLLDSSSRLIGVNTAIYSPTGAYAGIGFAIPVDTVNQVVPELIRQGKIERPGLGITIANAQNVRDVGTKAGVVVVDVLPGSPAAKAGLKSSVRDERGRLVRPGDVIVAVDGKPIANGDDLFDALARHKVGDVVKLTILRDGAKQDTDVTLEAV